MLTRVSFPLLLIPAILNAASSTITVSSSASPVIFGHAVTLTALVSPSTATGTVTFYAGTTVLETEPIVNGQATLTTTLLATGVQSLKAYYGGCATYSPAASTTLMQTVTTVSENGFQVSNYAGGSALNSVALGDFNADGKQDVAVGSSSGVEVMLGNGDGTFKPYTTYSTGSTAVATAVGDFNGDGKPDIALASQKGVFVLLGNGDGTFQTAVPWTSVSSSAIVVGDFNADGKADLAYGDASGTAVMLGNGDGTFAQPLAFSTVANPFLASADFNGDGIADLAFSTVSGSMGILLGNGDGTFRSGGTYITQTNLGPLAVGDFNGDGKTDIAVVQQNSAALNVYQGNGDGTLQAPVPYSVPGQPLPIAVGDVNGDGKLDLIVVDQTSYNASVLFGNGDGTFQQPVNFGAAPGYQAIAVGDFNGDGRADLATPGEFGLGMLLALGPASTTTLGSSPNPSSYSQGVTLTASVSPETATGTVTFFDAATTLGTGVLSNGIATFNATALSVGSHSLTAAYGGDANDAASTSTALTQSVTVRTSSTTLNSSPNPSTYGQTITLSATISPSTAKGTVTFYNQSTVVGTGKVTNGLATLSISNLAVGTYWYTATYGGDSNDTSSTSSVLVQTVSAITTTTTLTSSPDPSLVGQSVTLTAKVLPATATGTITFAHGSTSLGTAALNNGIATLSLSTLTAGGHSLTAAYGGDAHDLKSTSPPITQSVQNTTTTALTSSANPSNAGQKVTFTATVSPSTATGKVVFYRNSTAIGTGTLSGGVATFLSSAMAEGTYVFSAKYSGDPYDVTSTSQNLSQVVN